MTFSTLRATAVAFGADKAPRLAAAIAYSAVFSIAPLFVVVAAVATRILGANADAQAHLLDIVSHAAGNDAAGAVRNVVDSTLARPHSGVVPHIAAWIAFAFGASGLFSSLQDSLNAVWGIEGNKGGWRHVVRSRLASIAMVAFIGVILLASLVASGVIAVVASDVSRYVPLIGNPWLVALAGQIVNFAILTTIFALLFKVLPDVRLPWRDVIFGAAVTALLFTVGEYAISLYFALGGIASLYGAASALFLVLLWIYYSALILLFGAEFTKVHARRARLVVAASVRAVDDLPAGADPRTREGDVHRSAPVARSVK